ncbi:uncharacterized protein LOC130826447 [Amaranthus tricolor]|uniref:uncharacterized protein LOC130826447 n=1 Tax=Amaranthus tricolor TaxID=29722 RepID=UPI002582B6DD|nr:uncharacterized protein LOC130826447 [Amaranthus tricolor]
MQYSVVLNSWWREKKNKVYTVACLDAGYGWRLHASRLPDGTTWAIKKIDNPEHNCRALETHNSLVTIKWAATKLMDDIRANNDISGRTLNELLELRFRVSLKTSTLYKMRTLALKEINGGHYESYGYLPAEDSIERPLTFTSIFISFGATISGLVKGCKGLIGVDGAHLKGQYGGTLLSSIALDGNNHLFPIAWAIVSGEDQETWKFFVWHLKYILNDSGRGDD